MTEKSRASPAGPILPGTASRRSFHSRCHSTGLALVPVPCNNHLTVHLQPPHLHSTSNPPAGRQRQRTQVQRTLSPSYRLLPCGILSSQCAAQVEWRGLPASCTNTNTPPEAEPSPWGYQAVNPASPELTALRQQGEGMKLKKTFARGCYSDGPLILGKRMAFSAT